MQALSWTLALLHHSKHLTHPARLLVVPTDRFPLLRKSRAVTNIPWELAFPAVSTECVDLQLLRSSSPNDARVVSTPNFCRYYVPAIPLFCRTLTTTRRFWACPSAVLSLPTCRLSPIAPGASIRVREMWPCCKRNCVTLAARSSLNCWFSALLPTDEA